jgi:hypothetical protein
VAGTALHNAVLAEQQVISAQAASAQVKRHKTLFNKHLCPCAPALLCSYISPGTAFALIFNGMIVDTLQPGDISVLTTQQDWAWPVAMRDIFQPRGVNLLVADSTNDIVNVLRHRRIWTAILDIDFEQGGLWTLRIIRMESPVMPCILLVRDATGAILDEALQLDVFSVIHKPVDMGILKDQLNRLFVKRYGSHIFSK